MELNAFKTRASLGSMDIRIETVDGTPWFVALDVCRVLGLNQPTNAIRSLSADEKGRTLMATPGGRQQMSIISESGPYKLIMRSDKPEAG